MASRRTIPARKSASRRKGRRAPPWWASPIRRICSTPWHARSVSNDPQVREGADVMNSTSALREHDVIVRRIAVEYIEMPDLKLTAGQACRLWNIPADVCDLALAALVTRGFLLQTRT